MAGSIRPIAGRPGFWELRVFLGRDSAGRTRHRSRTFHGSRSQAERALARLVTEQDVTPESAPE
ncbi:MAG: hypothetical protein ACRDYC_11610, partial [Acidimicrobiales bacterium]